MSTKFLKGIDKFYNCVILFLIVGVGMDLNQAIKFINCKHSEDLPVKEKDLFYNDQDENSYDDLIFVLSTLTQKTDLLEKVIAKKSLNNIWFLKKFSGKGTLKKPFSVETEFGNWLVYKVSKRISNVSWIFKRLLLFVLF